MLESVKIIHNWDQIKEYRFWADFFRLIGVHVCDCTLKSERLSSDFNVVIILEKGISGSSLEILREHYPNAVFLNHDRKVRDVKYFDTVMAEIVANSKLISKKQMSIIREIGRIYIIYDLSYHRNAYNYFYNNQQIVLRAQERFEKAYRDVGRILSEEIEKFSGMEKVENANLFYTMAYLSKCINEICNFLNSPFRLSIKESLEFLNQALRIEPTFDNAYLLKGMISELEDDLKEKSEMYYEITLEQIYGKRYTSYSYYVIGRYYEKVKKDIKRAKELYTISLSLNNFEYRAIYKLAMIEKKKGKYEWALERFKMICNILGEKERNNYLQPREYEYLFKAYFEMGSIYGDYLLDTKRYEDSINKRNELCIQLMDEKEKNRAYNEIFGTNSKKFRNETYKRFFEIVVKCSR